MSQPTKRDSILPPSLPIQSTSKLNSNSSPTSITTTTSFLSPQITPFYKRILPTRIYLDQQVLGKEVASSYSDESSNNDDSILKFVDKVDLSENKASNRSLVKRQDAAGYPSCLNQPNYVLSCFPTPSTTLVQNIWSKFVFNSQFPTFIGVGKVDIYLYHADSETIATSYLGIESARGTIGILPGESWWPIETQWTVGSNRTFPYFFVIVDANSTLNGGEQHQATFSAIQTAPPATLLASIASASLSSASVASSLSSLTAHPSSSTIPTSSTPSSTGTTGTLQPSSSSSSGLSIPGWAIALIVVLGVFALVSGIVLSYFCIGGIRRRRNRDDLGETGGGGRRGRDSVSGSHGSQEPILASSSAANNVDKKHDPNNTSANESNNPINHDSALLMAEAYRSELRKPTFVQTPTRHSSTGVPIEGSTTGSTNYSPHGSENSGPILDRKSSGGMMGREIMNDSLAEEGQKISNVGGGKRWGAQGE